MDLVPDLAIGSAPDSAPDLAPDSVTDLAVDLVPDSAIDLDPDSVPDSAQDSAPDLALDLVSYFAARVLHLTRTGPAAIVRPPRCGCGSCSAPPAGSGCSCTSGERP
jgi:hypothetical protein